MQNQAKKQPKQRKQPKSLYCMIGEVCDVIDKNGVESAVQQLCPADFLKLKALLVEASKLSMFQAHGCEVK